MGGILVIFLGLFAFVAIVIFVAVLMLVIPLGLYEESHKPK